MSAPTKEVSICCFGNGAVDSQQTLGYLVLKAMKTNDMNGNLYANHSIIIAVQFVLIDILRASDLGRQ